MTRHAGYNPHRRPEHSKVATPERLLALAMADRTDRAACIAGRCVQCLLAAEAIRGCERRGCALWVLRPYQASEPKSAPHLERPQVPWDAVEEREEVEDDP